MEYDLDINLHCFAFVITKNLIKMIRAINSVNHIFFNINFSFNIFVIK